jgi:hypothetical protein
MSPSREPPDKLQNLLEEAESELGRRLHEACEAEARGVASESAEEIRRLEDTLLAAAMAAERTLAARRHLQDSSAKPSENTAEGRKVSPSARSRKETGAPQPTGPNTPETDVASEHGAPGSTAVREFHDESGRRWRAWPVTPDLARAREVSRRSLGDFQEGWICFEALDDSGRRRLPRRGRRWSDLPAEELPRLLAEAINVPSRKPKSPEISS